MRSFALGPLAWLIFGATVLAMLAVDLWGVVAVKMLLASVRPIPISLSLAVIERVFILDVRKDDAYRDSATRAVGAIRVAPDRVMRAQ